MAMRVVFRTDASVTIGTGHVMRCLALADALSQKGAICTFVCREHPGHLEDMIRRRGFSVVLLPARAQGTSPSSVAYPAHAAWLGAEWQDDAQQTVASFDTLPDYVIIDHYAIDSRWENAIRNHCRKILVVDDLADREHDCDLLLDQNFLPNPDRYSALLPAGASTLIGPTYALLRPEFACREVRATTVANPRLLIMFGGADRSRQTERVLQLLENINWSDPVDVVAGPLYPEMQALRELVTKLPSATLHIAPRNIATLMRMADFAVGAPGVASLERCACGLPSITVAQARNQEPIGAALADVGAHWYLGCESDATDSDWQDALRMLAKQPAIRRHMAKVASTICDGQGVSRVAERLILGAMSVRMAEQSDGNMLFVWRNDERTRRFSRDSRSLDYQAHLRWLEKTLNDPNVELLLLGDGYRDMACVRFDCQDETAALSIYVAPDLHGQGIGRRALAAAIDWLNERRPALRKLFAIVLESNHASRRLFLSSGFKPDQTYYVRDLQP